MTTPVDSSRRLQPVRRSAASADPRRKAVPTEDKNLPVPVSAARPIPAGSVRPGGDSAIEAQAIGERRGLRAGPTIHDEAKAGYVKTAWSGASDRRRPKGGAARTKI